MSTAPFDPKQDLVAVIMAGGAGTRFWPASTEARPKQFLTFFGDRSLLQLSYDRVAPLVGKDRVLVLTGQRFVGLVREQLPELSAENIIGEPLRRDTAAAVALGALLVQHRFGDAVIATLTSDHLIEPAEDFRTTLLSAARGAFASSALYTFGIEPSRPATEYGYLEVGERLPNDDEDAPHFSLTRFVEKPNAEKARSFVESGRFLWNSGMFVWRASSILGELERRLPAHLEHLRPALAHDRTPDFDAALLRAFEPLERTSVDFGVMEHARDVRCVRASFTWSDVGGFPALAAHLDEDEDGNVHRGALRTLDARGNIVFCDDKDEQVALVGVSDLVVVRAGRRTLIVPKARAEEIKRLVDTLPEEER